MSLGRCYCNIAGDIRYLGMRLVVDTAVMVAASRPADFLDDNLALQTNIIRYAIWTDDNPHCSE